MTKRSSVWPKLRPFMEQYWHALSSWPASWLVRSLSLGKQFARLQRRRLQSGRHSVGANSRARDKQTLAGDLEKVALLVAACKLGPKCVLAGTKNDSLSRRFHSFGGGPPLVFLFLGPARARATNTRKPISQASRKQAAPLHWLQAADHRASVSQPEVAQAAL